MVVTAPLGTMIPAEGGAGYFWFSLKVERVVLGRARQQEREAPALCNARRQEAAACWRSSLSAYSARDPSPRDDGAHFRVDLSLLS